jgi:hypothetical protein
MEKIFDKEVQKYLKGAGVSEKEINKIKFNAIKSSALAILERVTSLIKADMYDKVSDFTSVSPSGDGFGCDNVYIEFGDVIGEHGIDIYELCKRLKNLKSND